MTDQQQQKRARRLRCRNRKTSSSSRRTLLGFCTQSCHIRAQNKNKTGLPCASVSDKGIVTLFCSSAGKRSAMIRVSDQYLVELDLFLNELNAETDRTIPAYRDGGTFIYSQPPFLAVTLSESHTSEPNLFCSVKRGRIDNREFPVS